MLLRDFVYYPVDPACQPKPRYRLVNPLKTAKGLAIHS